MIFTDTNQLFTAPLLSTTADIAIRNAGGIVDVAGHTEKWFGNCLNQLIKFTGNIRIDHLTPQLINDWHKSTAERTTAVTANNYLRGVRTIYNRLLNLNLIAQNPAIHIPYLPEPPATPRAIHEATYHKLRAATVHARNTAIVDTLWATGCRVGELLSMQVGSCELWHDDGRACAAVLVTGKFGRSRHVYAAGIQAESITQWIEERPSTRNHNSLFTSFTGSPLTHSGIYSLIRNLRQRNAITERCNPHSFRHAFAIRMLDEGHDLPTVSAWLGHTSTSFTARVYVIRREDELRRKFFE